jgi:hypothetical protein
MFVVERELYLLEIEVEHLSQGCRIEEEGVRRIDKYNDRKLRDPMGTHRIR